MHLIVTAGCYFTWCRWHLATNTGSFDNIKQLLVMSDTTMFTHIIPWCWSNSKCKWIEILNSDNLNFHSNRETLSCWPYQLANNIMSYDGIRLLLLGSVRDHVYAYNSLMLEQVFWQVIECVKKCSKETVSQNRLLISFTQAMYFLMYFTQHLAFDAVKWITLYIYLEKKFVGNQWINNEL